MSIPESELAAVVFVDGERLVTLREIIDADRLREVVRWLNYLATEQEWRQIIRARYGSQADNENGLIIMGYGRYNFDELLKHLDDPKCMATSCFVDSFKRTLVSLLGFYLNRLDSPH